VYDLARTNVDHESKMNAQINNNNNRAHPVHVFNNIWKLPHISAKRVKCKALFQLTFSVFFWTKHLRCCVPYETWSWIGSSCRGRSCRIGCSATVAQLRLRGRLRRSTWPPRRQSARWLDVGWRVCWARSSNHQRVCFFRTSVCWAGAFVPALCDWLPLCSEISKRDLKQRLNFVCVFASLSGIAGF